MVPEPEPDEQPTETQSALPTKDYRLLVLKHLRQPRKNKRKMTIFDFAGQRMYYVMHHIFISPRLSIYLVVFSLAKAPKDALEGEDAECGVTQLDNLHFWLNSIHAQAPDAPVIVVATHRASISDAEAESRLDTIHESFAGKPFAEPLRMILTVLNRFGPGFRA